MGFQDMNTEDFTDEFGIDEPFGAEPLPEFDDTGGGGISPIFKIIGALMVVVVLIIVVVLVVVAMRNNDGLTDRQKEATSIAATNQRVAQDAEVTGTAVAIAIEATATELQQINLTATVTVLAITAMYEENLTATSAAATESAQATASAEAADATATYEAEATGTAAYEQRTLRGNLTAPGNLTLGNTQIYLFRDNGDMVFSPEDAVVPTPVPPTINPSDLGPISQTETAIAMQSQPQAPAIMTPTGDNTTPETVAVTLEPGTNTPEPGANADLPGAGSGQLEPGPANPILYGESMTGTLDTTFLSRWTFQGAAGDLVSITADPIPGAETDIFLALVGPDGATLAEAGADDAELGAVLDLISLPDSGEYTIQVSTQTVPGQYQITLVGETPTSLNIEGLLGAGGGRFGGPRQGGETPTPEPTSISGDEFIDAVLTDPETGEFVFEGLEPGVYWLVVDYAALPADIQAQIINPTPQIAIMVNVPVTGQVTWEINPENLNTNAPPTQTTGTPPQIVTLTPPSLEPGADQVTNVVVGSPAMPGSGIFSDAGDSIDDATDNSNGLTVLAIAAVGLVAVVFIARKLRTS